MHDRLLASHLLPLLALSLLSLGACSKSDPKALPSGFDKVDHEIKIGVRNGLLRYDIEEFYVRPGSRVKLTLDNNDSMQHNFLLCKAEKGVLDRVAKAVLALGDRASEKDFVPRSRAILQHTRALLPGESQTLFFEAPKKLGRYPYICTLPGHTYSMRGVMIVGEAPEPLLSELRYESFPGSFKKLAEMDGVAAEKTGELPKGLIDLAAIGMRKNYGVRFRGTLRVKRPGKYRFYLRSDDGSRLRIDGKDVVAHDGTHPPNPEQKGSAQLKSGAHEFQVDFFQGGGGQAIFLDIEGPGIDRTSLCAKRKAAAKRSVPIMVMHDPVVMRVHVEGASARSVAIGLPHGISCVFDAESCRMNFGWVGAFLDVAPDRLGRGGKPCKILGERFSVGDLGFPLRRNGSKSAEQAQPTFRGYETGKTIKLLLDWQGQELSWGVARAKSGIGLRYDFELPGIASGVSFTVDPKGLELTSSAGSWEGGKLTLTREEAAKFSVSLRPRALGAAHDGGHGK